MFILSSQHQTKTHASRAAVITTAAAAIKQPKQSHFQQQANVESLTAVRCLVQNIFVCRSAVDVAAAGVCCHASLAQSELKEFTRALESTLILSHQRH